MNFDIQKINIFANAELTGVALAEKLFYLISTGSEMINIAVSGGSTPTILFKILADNYAEKIPWNRVNFYWVDERFVPPNHSESNYKLTKESLFNRISIPQKNIFRIKGENDPEEEADRYSKVILKNVPRVNGLPVFDIILLGIGADGHTASIFPNHMELLLSDSICAGAVHPESGQKRLTLTGKVINNGKAVFFLVCGKSKADILNRIITGAGRLEKALPAACISGNNSNVYFFLDKEAGFLLK